MKQAQYHFIETKRSLHNNHRLINEWIDTTTFAQSCIILHTMNRILQLSLIQLIINYRNSLNNQDQLQKNVYCPNTNSVIIGNMIHLKFLRSYYLSYTTWATSRLEIKCHALTDAHKGLAFYSLEKNSFQWFGHVQNRLTTPIQRVKFINIEKV